MGWLSVELSSSSAGMRLSDIKYALSKSCPNSEIFVPITEEVDVNGQVITTVLCEGYAFIKHVPDFALYKLQRCSIVISVLSELKRGQLVPAIISDDKIDRMRRQLADIIGNKISDNSKVQILSGLYSGLSGDVVVIIDNEAIIKIREVKSKTILATVPLGGIKLVEG